MCIRDSDDGHADDGHAPVSEPSVEEVEQPVHRHAQEDEPAVRHDVADGGVGEVQVAQVGVEFGTGVDAVSYTHLDVYKRQQVHDLGYAERPASKCEESDLAQPGEGAPGAQEV